MWARSPTLALSRRTLHYPRVDLDKQWNECGHDRPSWHYFGLPFTIQNWISTNICKVDILQNGIGPIWGNVGLIGSTLSKVDLDHNLAKLTLSGAKIEQSGHDRGQGLFRKKCCFACFFSRVDLALQSIVNIGTWRT